MTLDQDDSWSELAQTIAAEGPPDDGYPPDDAQRTSAVLRARFPKLDWHDLWNTEGQDEDWIIEPLLPARRLIALYSAPKVGKSLLMLELAVRVAQGVEVLGVRPDRPRRVLYVDFENDPRGDVRTRLQAMGVGPPDLANLCYLSFPTMAKLDTWAGASDLRSTAIEYGCEVVVIDTISRAVAGEENDNDTWNAFYRHTGVELKRAGITCVRLDHSGKDPEKGMRGGSAKYSDVDAVWRLTRVTDDTFRLDCTDHRMRIVEDTIVLRREMTPHLRHVVHGEGRAAAYKAKVAEVVDLLDDHDVPADTGRDGAREFLKRMGHRASNATVAEAVRRRKDSAGLLEIPTEGPL